MEKRVTLSKLEPEIVKIENNTNDSKALTDEELRALMNILGKINGNLMYLITLNNNVTVTNDSLNTYLDTIPFLYDCVELDAKEKAEK